MSIPLLCKVAPGWISIGCCLTLNPETQALNHLSSPAGWPQDRVDERREALHRVLTASVVRGRPQGVHYYQGMHDVAAVLLLVADEPGAYRMLTHLSTCHLRDCTRWAEAFVGFRVL